MDNESDVPPAWAVRLYEGTLEQFGLVRAEMAAGFKSISGEIEMLKLAVGANSADLREMKAEVGELRTEVQANTTEVEAVKREMMGNSAVISLLRREAKANTADLRELKVAAGRGADIAEVRKRAEEVALRMDAIEEMVRKGGQHSRA